MKKLITGLILTWLSITPALADVYVKVDANGNAIGGAIMCDASTCGAGSQYSQLTLQAGERYALQGTGQAGIGNNNPNTQLKVDLQTNEWTVTRQIEIKLVEPLIINNQSVISYTVQTVQTFTPATSPGNDSPALVMPIVQTIPVTDTTSINAGSTTMIINPVLTTPSVKTYSVKTATKSVIKVTEKEKAKKLVKEKKK